MTDETQGVTNEQFIAVLFMIAQVAHAVNRAYCLSLGDETIPAWEDAPEYMKQSTLDGVAYRYQNPECTPEQMHTNWKAQKTRDGWVYGAVKDPALKMHPCMVTYDKLPQEQRSKDYLFSSVVDEMLKLFG